MEIYCVSATYYGDQSVLEYCNTQKKGDCAVGTKDVLTSPLLIVIVVVFLGETGGIFKQGPRPYGISAPIEHVSASNQQDNHLNVGKMLSVVVADGRN